MSNNIDREYKIVADYDNLKISMKGWELDCARSMDFKLRYNNSLIKFVAEVVTGISNSPLRDIMTKLNTKYSGKIEPKDIYKEFAKKYKITPATLYNTARKIHYKVLCEGIGKSVLHAVSYNSPYKRIVGQVKGFKEVKPMLIQCVKDGNHNVTPIVAALNMDTESCKKLLGKSLWKKLCSNSITKNSLIAYNYRYHISRGHDKVAILNVLHDTPSFILKYARSHFLSLRTISKISTICKNERKVSDLDFIRDLKFLISDTIRICDKLGFTYNKNWSYKRLIKEHDRLSCEIKKLKYSKEEYPYVKKAEFNEIISSGYGVANLIKSPLELANEGSKMKHCVDSYNESCLSGDYVVYSLTDDEGNRSTLGFYVKTSEEGVINISGIQHTGVCNKRPSPHSSILKDYVTENFLVT